MFIKFCLDGLILVAVAAAAVAEHGLDAVEELLLPFADLDRVDLVDLRQLGEGLGLLGGVEGDPSLERRRVSIRRSGHVYIEMDK